MSIGIESRDMPLREGLTAAQVQTARRFWARTVQKGTGCWEWQAALGPGGYGQLCARAFGGRLWQAHRLAWVITRGTIPDGLVIAHLCDNRRCVNPSHLQPMTRAENSQDMVHKNRHRAALYGINNRGELSGMAKLTQAQVDEIRKLYSTGDYRQINLATRFGVSREAISHIVMWRTWRG